MPIAIVATANEAKILSTGASLGPARIPYNIKARDAAYFGKKAKRVALPDTLPSRFSNLDDVQIERSPVCYWQGASIKPSAAAEYFRQTSAEATVVDSAGFTVPVEAGCKSPFFVAVATAVADVCALDGTCLAAAALRVFFCPIPAMRAWLFAAAAAAARWDCIASNLPARLRANASSMCRRRSSSQ
jgi:hypothetical protein